MKRDSILLAAVTTALVACGGGEPSGEPATGGSQQPAAAPPAAAPPAAASGELTMPSWMQVDNAARTVTMTITAGATDKQNYWNFNGTTNGEMTVTVPEGYTVTIELVNDDPMMAHSLGISTQTGGFGANVDTTPAFPGAITPNPTSMVDGTMPGETATIEFVAGTAGEYTIVCYVPGHAAVGMWTRFNVSSSGEAGVQGAVM